MTRLRRLLLVFPLVISFLVGPPSAVDAAQKTHVEGYTKKDGTTVKAHERKAPKSKAATTPKAAKPKKESSVKTPAVSQARDERGRFQRSEAARHAFARQTGYPHGRPGWVIDHIIPLACGGRDDQSNMQWQTAAQAKAKDKVERRGCR
jgi:5-methylcytosine-specific restriction endonuclease McrA